jgi:recombination protein RecT
MEGYMSENQTRAVAVAQREQVRSLREFLEAPAVRGQIANALPKHLTPGRVLRQAMTLVQKTPALLECSQHSILAGIVQASELGQAYLVPRWNGKIRAKEAVFQVGYRGLIDLAYRSGQVQSFSLRVVHAHEPFRVFLGSHSRIEHEPCLDGDPGAAVAYYAVVKLSGGGEDFEVMSRAQVEAHRAKYSPATGGQSPWQTAFDEMALKTVARRLAKRLPLSVEFQEAAVQDEYHEAGVGLEQGRVVAAPLAPPSRTEEVLAKLDHVGAGPEAGEAGAPAAAE